MREHGEKAAGLMRGSIGAATSALLATISVAMIAGGLLLQRAFDVEVLGPLAILLWPGWLAGAMFTVLGVIGFGLAVVSAATTMGVVAMQRQRVR